MPNEVSSNRFTFCKRERTIVAEITSLPVDVFGRIYEDAADCGFSILSNTSGKLSTWYFAENLTHGGELFGWKFLPTPETLRSLASLEGWEVHVLND